jgi:hypothetical protein
MKKLDKSGKINHFRERIPKKEKFLFFPNKDEFYRTFLPDILEYRKIFP